MAMRLYLMAWRPRPTAKDWSIAHCLAVFASYNPKRNVRYGPVAGAAGRGKSHRHE